MKPDPDAPHPVRTTATTIRGLPVYVFNARPDITTDDVLRRLDESLGLIEQYVPHHFRRMARDFSRILVQRYACRGAYIPDQGACLVELTFTVNPDFSAAQIAATILHEAMHARLHRLGFPLEMTDRARQERFCRRAEIEFGNAVPGGAPIVDRARESLAAPDDQVAPLIDPVLAAQRVAQADRDALARAGDSRVPPVALLFMNRQRTILPVVLAVGAVLLGTATVRAQTLTGTVRSSGVAIVGATVRLLELDRTVHTDAGGQFRFSSVPTGTYTVFVGTLGYTAAVAPVHVVTATTTTAFDLTPSAIPLAEVIVSASPLPRAANDLYQSTASKSQVAFLNSAGSSFAEKISDLPGVTVRLNGSAPARPIVRGLGDNEVLVLENGLRMGDLATFDPAHATPIEAMAVSQIDVVRGPATILYGPNTIGGLVNVITDAVPSVAGQGASGSVAVELNSVSDQVAAYANNVFSSGNHAFRIAAGGVHAQDIRIPSGTQVDPGTGTPFALDRMPQSFNHSGEFGLGYSYQSAGATIGVGAKHYEMNYGIPGVPPNPDWINAPPTTSRIAQNRNTVELRGLFSVGGSFVKQWKLDANYNDYGHSEFPTQQDSTGVSDPQANHFHERDFNGVLQLRHQPRGGLEGTFGVWVNVQDLTIEGDQPLGPNSLTTDFAGYAYEEYRAAHSTRLQAGLRFDYNKIQTRPFPQSSDSVFRTINASRLANAVTASLGLIHQLTPNVTGSFSLARSFRAPTVQELFANGLDAASGTYSVGTATLGPETGVGVDASLKGSFAAATFEISPYVNAIDHYIYGFLRGDTIQNFPVRQFAATRARLAGFEASVTVQPARRFAITAGGDYVNAEDTRRHVPLPFTPPLRGLVRGSYQDRTYLGLIEWRLAASQHRLGDGDTPTSGYAVMNVGVGVRLVQHGVVHNISLHCDNVFNTVYRDHLSVIKDFLPQPGRGFRLNYELLY